MRPLNALVLAMLTLASPVCAAQPEAPAQAPEYAEEHAELLALIEDARSMRRFGIDAAPAKAADSIRIATYNVLNLFDDADDPALTGDQDDAGETKELHERLAVAQAIRELDADVLCLQEIESEAALLWFRDAFLSDLGYEHVACIDAGDERGIEQAVLSRRPILKVENWPQKPLGGIHPDKYGPNAKNWYAGEPINFHRSPLRVDVNMGTEADPQPLTLMVVHHKSGRYSGYWREAEARGAIAILEDLAKSHPGRPIMILGDFNAEPSDESVKLYLNAGFDDIFADRRGSKSITTHESGRRIDLVLVNDAARSHLLVDKAFVLGTAARPQGVYWRDLPTFVGMASDHYPVAVDYRSAQNPGN